MNKKIILIALLSAWWKAQAQQKDSLPATPLPDKTEIQALWSYYTQEGDHSAVTGGAGTEKLQVQMAMLKGKHRITPRKTIFWNAGCDFITSASTDNIDFVRSSASYKDQRANGMIGYGYTDRKQTEWQVSAGASMESDYLSYPLKASVALPKKNKQQWQFKAEFAFDDLRWGRLNPDYQRPVTVVYPKELRYRQWYDTYRRTSGTLIVAHHSDINLKTTLSLYGSFALQEGLLSTPFHRIYFNNDSVAVEQLPETRIKLAFSGELRRFAGHHYIAKTSASIYSDNYGINAMSLEEDLSRKIRPGFYLGPFFRVYGQTASKYFAKKGAHIPGEHHYTSDYDLSEFYAVQAGFSLQLYPAGNVFKVLPVTMINFRGSYYHRSDGLHFLTTSLLITIK